MGKFVQKANALAPLAHLERAELPGTDQARRIEHCEQHGIAMQPHHLRTLLELAAELDVPVPGGISRGIGGSSKL